MGFLEKFKDCGYFYQCTNEHELAQKLQNQKITAYVGFDCTASSLHVGNLMQIMILRLLQRHGHKPIILIGGATTKIGDPTGKEEARKYLSDQEIKDNIAGIKKSLSKFISFGKGSTDAIMLNNSDWLENIGYIEFLRTMGKKFSVNRMLTMDSVKLRLQREQSLTFLEFNYMLLQAYDFYHLNKNYGCNLQLGGSDQWGNIVTGVDLIRKMNGVESFGLTTPLLTTASGSKMGKSLGGAIWLNEDQITPYDYYQYWRNTEDADVVKFSKLYCEFSDEEQKAFENLAQQDINAAKKKLAHSITSLCHGKANADAALTTATQVFEQGAVGEELATIETSEEKLESGILCHELFFQSGLVQSKGEARRLVRGQGAKINDQKVLDENSVIDMSFVNDGVIKLSSGKKKHVLVKIIK